MDVMKVMKVYGQVSDAIKDEMVGYDVTEVKEVTIAIEMQDGHCFEIDLTGIVDKVFDRPEESDHG